MPVYTWTSWQYKATVRVRHALGFRVLVEIGGHLVPHPIARGTYYRSKLGQTFTFWSDEDGYLALDSPHPTCGEGLQGAFEHCETRIESSGKWYWSIGALEFVTRVEYEIDLQLGDWYPCVIQGDVGLCWSLTEELRRIIVAESQPPESQPT
jgi:hypothetical protein